MQFAAVEFVFVTGPSCTVRPDPIGTVPPCVAVTVGAADGDTVFNVVGPGVAAVGAPTAGKVFTGVGLTVGLTAGPVAAAAAVPVAEGVAEATAAEAKALAAAESAGADVATPGDEIAALGNALDAAATAGPDDAALL